MLMIVNYAPQVMFVKLAIIYILKLEIHVFFVQLPTVNSVIQPVLVLLVPMDTIISMDYAILNAHQIVTKPQGVNHI
jgi:hypothetical protein